MKKILQYAVLVIPIGVAASQLYFSRSFDLSSWKGGGFGMYTEPHPNSSRTIWLEGQLDNARTAFRICPLDARVAWHQVTDDALRAEFETLYRVAKKGQNFPSWIDVKALRHSIDTIQAEALERWTGLHTFPRQQLRLKVLQTQIAPDYQKLEVKTILEREL